MLQASIEKAAWRELHALTVKGLSQNTNGGPAALQNISDKEAFDLWVGGLVANKAKPVDTTESVFYVPVAMLTAKSQMVYEGGVRLASSTEFRVMRAVSVYHKELGDNLDRPEMRNRRHQVQSSAAAQYWTDIESVVPRLLDVAAAPESLGLKSKWHKTAWGQSVRRAARAAYEHARYAFQLCANPTKKVSKERSDGSLTKNGRRVPLGKREELVEYIKRKGDEGGFTVDESTLRTFSRGREYFEKRDQNGHRMTGLHSAVEFEGVLTVTDPAKFYGSFTRGIGSAKAFGFGLLVIAPIA